MNALTTPEVIRLLEGGNESALAKWNMRTALEAASHIPGAIIEYLSPFSREWREVRNVQYSNAFHYRITITSEIVTRELGFLHGYNLSAEQRLEDIEYVRHSRPAIVISTE
jgi:hypothetical protein